MQQMQEPEGRSSNQGYPTSQDDEQARWSRPQYESQQKLQPESEAQYKQFCYGYSERSCVFAHHGTLNRARRVDGEYSWEDHRGWCNRHTIQQHRWHHYRDFRHLAALAPPLNHGVRFLYHPALDDGEKAKTCERHG